MHTNSLNSYYAHTYTQTKSTSLAVILSYLMCLPITSISFQLAKYMHNYKHTHWQGYMYIASLFTHTVTHREVAKLQEAYMACEVY